MLQQGKEIEKPRITKFSSKSSQKWAS